MTLPAREFASGWLNTSLASGSDDKQPSLYRTVLVETFGTEALQLVASDGSMLLRCTMESTSGGLGLHSPTIDTVPDEVHIVVDRHGRMRNLMGWVLREAKTADNDDDEYPPVSLEVRSGERPMVPTLSPDLDRRVLVVSTEHERLDLDLYEGSYLSWRALFAGHVQVATAEMAFNPTLLARLGKLREIRDYVTFSFGGPNAGACFVAAGEPSIEGVLMPVRIGPGDPELGGDE